MAFTTCVISCEEAKLPLYAAKPILAMNPRLVVDLGDTPYYNTALTAGGYTGPVLTTSSTVQNIKDRVHAMWSKKGWRELKLARANGLIFSWCGEDDHRWADSADHTVAMAESGGGPIGTPGTVTQAQVNAVATNWYTAHRELGNTYWDYPTAESMAANNGDVPSGPGLGGEAMPASAFPIIYHYLDFDRNGALGGNHVRGIVPDLITYRSPTTATDNASKTAFGATQKAWFLNAVKDAHDRGFKHIVLISSKKLFARTASGRYGNGENSDTWGAYSTERDEVLTELHNYGARIVTMSGDRHTPNVVYRTTADGYAYDALDLCACPVSVENNDTGQGDTPGQIWLRSAASRREPVFGSLVFNDDDTLTMAIRHGISGAVRWSCSVAPRSNTPIYA